MENKIYEGNNIQGWMMPDELQFLYEQASKMKSVLEIGSWKGRSTHAILSGCKGRVTCVDTFAGSAQEGDATHTIAQQEDIYKQFMDNVGHFTNLRVIKATSKEASDLLKNEKFDMIFIDGGHLYGEVKEDIALWKDKATVMLCGHDYLPGIWPDVCRAVDESLQKDGVAGSIWFKNIEDEKIINMFTGFIKDKENFSFIKHGDGEKFCESGMIGENCDGHPYSPELGKRLKEAFDFFSLEGNCWVADFSDQEFFNVLLHRKGKNNQKVKEFYKAIRNDNRKKYYIGPSRLRSVARLLEAEHIVIPEKNAFKDYDRILGDILNIVYRPNDNNSIFLFSCGMTAKVLIHSLMKSLSANNTYLDLGSAFDSLIGETRTNQLPRKDILDLYADWLLE
jgi:Methyltransferase domain